jgi:hypothetical protein
LSVAWLQVVEVFSNAVDETHTRGNDKILAHFVSFLWNGRIEVHMESLIDLQPLSELGDSVDATGHNAGCYLGQSYSPPTHSPSGPHPLTHDIL